MQTIKLKIEKAAYGGYGLGFHEGKATFVPFGVPGDIAELKIYKEKKNHSFGHIQKLLERAKTRKEPRCTSFGKCGGCDYLHVSYSAELSMKEEILLESLLRIAGLSLNQIPEIPLIHDNRFHYRSHASIKCNKHGDIGFFQKDSHNLIPFPSVGCQLLAEPLIENLSIQQNIDQEEFKIACSHNNQCILSTDQATTVHESVNEIQYEHDIGLFFQANRFLRSTMLDIVEEYAGLSSSETFVDIGCGVGFFTLSLASKASKGVGFDISKQSIKWAKHNAKLNSCENVDFYVQSASDIHPFRSEFKVMIADPPRSGLSKKARKTIKAISPERIVYVSCNPTTFARDLRDFYANGYSMQRITLIDMFPGTYHIEVIALFVR